MSPAIRNYLGTMVLVLSTLVAFDAHCQMTDLNATAVEIAQLPKFCLGQMGVPNAKGPEYGFPYSCGPGMNHYCPGLVYLIRGKSAGSKGKSVSFLRRAEGDTRYTENALKDFPSCPIRGHVETTKAEIQNLLTIYGAKRSGTK